MRSARHIWLLVVLLGALGACGPGARTKALQSSLTALNAARDGFIQWDRQHQLDIVKKASSKEEARANLDAYRKKRQVLVESFTLAYAAFAAAALDNSTARLGEATRAAAAVYRLVKELRK